MMVGAARRGHDLFFMMQLDVTQLPDDVDRKGRRGVK